MGKGKSNNRIIDLTLSYAGNIRGYSTRQVKTVGRDGWNASELTIYSHAGTHMDAPFHFGVSDERIDQFPVRRFIIHCHLVSLKVTTDSFLIPLEAVSGLADQLIPGEGIVIRTGWSEYVNEPRYRNGLPRISKELAEWMVEKKVAFLGVEPPSVADVNNLEEVTSIHRILLGGDVIIVEGLTNLDQLSTESFTIIALPLKIAGGDGAPARVIAIEEL